MFILILDTQLTELFNFSMLYDILSFAIAMTGNGGPDDTRMCASHLGVQCVSCRAYY